jgi:hypothetical protein
MRLALRVASAALVASSLAACGGGDDDPTPPAAPQTAISYRGTVGDYISQGRSGKVTDAGFTVTTTYEAGYFRTQFFSSSSPPTTWWILDIASPNGEPLAPGRYIDAWRASFRNGHNGLDFFGDGRGCNTVFGSFTVLEIGYDTMGRLNRFAADFEQRCESVTSPLVYGSVRINSAIALTY